MPEARNSDSVLVFSSQRGACDHTMVDENIELFFLLLPHRAKRSVIEVFRTRHPNHDDPIHSDSTHSVGWCLVIIPIISFKLQESVTAFQTHP